MLPERARVAETREWLQKGDLDRRAAEFDLTAEPPLTADVVFHAQQFAEKSLKAFLVWSDEPFRSTHNLVEIGKQCVALDVSLETLVRRAAPLSEYAWKYRYPGEPAEPELAEAQEALTLAREVYLAILGRLPPEVKP
jgi:HEPN domain-containing protein